MNHKQEKRFTFRSLRTRLLVFVLALLLPVLLLIYLYVTYQNREYTADTIDSYLALGADVFDFSREEHKDTLLTITSTLTRDWGFRNAFGSGDRRTIRDSAETLLARSFGAAQMMLITDLDGEVIIDTLDQELGRLEGEWRALMEQARQSQDGVADTVMVVDGVPYQMTVVPLFLPTPVAWIFGGFALDEAFVETIKQTIVSDVSILQFRRDSDGVTQEIDMIASTLDAGDRERLPRILDPDIRDRSQRLSMQDGDYGSLLRSLYGTPGDSLEVVAAIQRSYDENEANLAVFQQRLLQFYVLVVVLSILAAVVLARSVTEPLLALMGRVRRIDQGDYRDDPEIPQHLREGRDEVARLTQSVESMARGLAERERVRSLLGKVVSHEIADELLSRKLELGGEERVVSVLFADIRGFTALSEGQEPARVLELLNHYLSAVSEAIEDCHGVVDKYTGDAVMALFGAPLRHAEDARNAVQAVSKVMAAVKQAALGHSDDPEAPGLEVGVGLHTGQVVAGNMGSSNRMNYTVIGDAVNLASRLEGLTRFYQVGNVVSQATREAAGDGFIWRELDLVRVKGRQEAVRIFELLGPVSEVEPARMHAAREFADVLARYRAQDWEGAMQGLQRLHAESPEVLYEIYMQRIRELQVQVPEDWDGTHSFDSKTGA